MLRPLPELALLTSLLLAPAFSQPFHRESGSIPVLVASDTLPIPFAGGINTPNHQFADIDGDGDADLFIFDGDQHLDFYRNVGTRASARFALQEIAFPSFALWFLLADLDGDGALDLLTDDSTRIGVRFYVNAGSPSVPSFLLRSATMTDTAGNAIQGAPIGVPALVDLNGDGTLDLLSSNIVNGSLNFYKNVGTRTNPRFAFVTDHLDNILVLGDTCTTQGTLPKRTNLHGGAALRFADLHRSGVLDLYYGDLFSHGLFEMPNAGTPSAPQLQCGTNRYPDASLVNFGFNQASLVDIDGDGDLDLFVGVLNNMYRHGFWYYENTGDSLAPSFTLRTKDALGMIDAGGNSSPALADLNGDGLADLVIGADQSTGGVLWYFRNTGTARSPAYTLADTIFGGVAGNNTFAPAFADLTGDGTLDLAVGFFSGAVKIFLNTGTRTTPAYPATPDLLLATGASNASPAFTDIDGDGDVDLFVGKSNGSILFYRNDGTQAQPQFVLASTAFGGISVGEYAKPAFADLDQDGDPDLFVGNAGGTIAYYENTGSPLLAQFVLRTSAFAATDPMRSSGPAFADLDGDTDLDLLVGNSKGGVEFYRNGLLSAVVEHDRPGRGFRLEQNYPNPFNPATLISYTLEAPARVTLAVLDLFGREVARIVDERQQAGPHAARWHAVDFASGVYYYRLTTERAVEIRPMMLIK